MTHMRQKVYLLLQALSSPYPHTVLPASSTLLPGVGAVCPRQAYGYATASSTLLPGCHVPQADLWLCTA